MSAFDRNYDAQPTHEINLPQPDQIIRWPEIVHRQEIDQRRLALETQISGLQAQKAALRERLATGEYKPASVFDADIDPDLVKWIKSRARAREQEDKATVMQQLRSVGLQDGEVATARFVIDVDHDMAGSYNVYHDVLMAQQVGVYLLSEQITFGENTGIERNLAPYGYKALIHEDASEPLQLNANGEFASLATAAVTDMKPVQWYSVQGLTRGIIDAVRTDRLIKSALSLLPFGEMKPVEYRSGYVDHHEMYVEQVIPLGQDIFGKINSVVVSGSKSDETRAISPLHTEIDEVNLKLVTDDTVQQQYVLDIRSLEVRPDRYANGQPLHDKAAALLQIARTALAKADLED